MDANSRTPTGTSKPNAHGIAAEPDRVPTKIAVSLYGLLALTAIVSAIVVFVFFRVLQKGAERVDRAEIAEAGLERPPDTLPPAPRLQIHAVANWNAYRNAENDRLSSYGWLNRDSGAVHIPVDRAMQLVLERGVGPLPPAAVTIPQAPEAGGRRPEAEGRALEDRKQ
jgi:hypothetical protein